MKHFLSLAVMWVICSATAFAAPPSTPVPNSWFGITFHHLGTAANPETWPSIPFGMTRSWDSNAVGGGVGLGWNKINTAKGVYDWSAFDSWVATAASHGVTIIYTVANTPQWASSNPSQKGSYDPGNCAPPSDNSNYIAFINALLTRAAGRIRIIEGWNEPNDSAFFCGTVNQVVTLQQLLYQTVKAFDPTILVLSPAINGIDSTDYLDSMVGAGMAQWSDAIAAHYYFGWYNVPEAVNTYTSTIRTIMANHGVNKPVWDTEGSWLYDDRYTLDERIAFVSRYLMLLWSNSIAGTIWYAWDNALFGTLYNETTSGYLPLGPNEAANAYYQTYTWMLGATMTSECAAQTINIGIVWTCGFSRPDGSQALAVWRPGGSSPNYSPPPQYHQYRDLDGNVVQITGQNISIGTKPILLEPGTALIVK